MRILCSLKLHKWGKWVSYDQIIITEYFDVWTAKHLRTGEEKFPMQRRECERCGITMKRKEL